MSLATIDRQQYRLLVNLFRELADRGEWADQLGQNGAALRLLFWINLGLSVLLTALFLAGHPSPLFFSTAILLVSVFMLLTVIPMEAVNSLMNPAETFVLLHHPISSQTYTAAKLTHLLRILAHLVPALNVLPAAAGLCLPGAPWYFPIAHLLAAAALAIVTTLGVCAALGWMLRVVPVSRLKSWAQFAAALPVVVINLIGPSRRLLPANPLSLLPVDPAWQWTLVSLAALAAALLVWFGLRALSSGYLLRLHAITQGHRRPTLPSPASRIAARFGGQPARAAFHFCAIMMRRDWQFRRQLLSFLILLIVGAGATLTKGRPPDPFLAPFSYLHGLPHALGSLLLLTCTAIPQTSQPQGAWVFVTVPPSTYSRYAAGFFALLWSKTIVIPHLILFPLLAWSFHPFHAAAFLLFSLAVSTLYLAVALRLTNGAPFTRPADPTFGAALLPIMLITSLLIAAAVSAQHFLLFRSLPAVLAATLVLAPVAVLMVRHSIEAFAATINYHFGLVNAASGPLYKEVDT